MYQSSFNQQQHSQMYHPQISSPPYQSHSLKKIKVSENHLIATSDSAHGGFNLNEDADDLDAGEEDVQEVRPMDRDRSKKKMSSSSVHFESSTATAPAYVEQLESVALSLFSQKNETTDSYLELKQRQLNAQLVKGSDKAVEGSKKAKEGSSKRAASNLEQGDAKRQRLEEENESAKLKRCLEIILEDDDDVTIEATPISFKSPTIVDYKIYKEGRKSFFKIIREYDNIWKYQQGSAKVLNWKLFYSCGVYCVTTKNMVYYLLVEKMYLFTRNILHQIWNDVRLQVDYEVEMAYNLLRLIKRQINKGYVLE
uniref:Uncharacterized protein n=1 Tax=Tanacetum cinerariifolium TaxID=118510 RepID=A0A6L2MQH4_TANCI|nr:hypothetical protein [Tanacetum cinerariifolium]